MPSPLREGLSVGLGRCETCGVPGARYHPPYPDIPLQGIWMCDSCLDPRVVRDRMAAEHLAYRKERADDLVDDWHNSPDDGVSLHEFLGMTWDQYKRWVESVELPDGWTFRGKGRFAGEKQPG